MNPKQAALNHTCLRCLTKPQQPGDHLCADCRQIAQSRRGQLLRALGGEPLPGTLGWDVVSMPPTG